MSLNNITVPDDMISLKKGNEINGYVIWSNELLKNENNFLTKTEYRDLNYNFYIGTNFPFGDNFATYSYFCVDYINVSNNTNQPYGQLKLLVSAYFNYSIPVSLPTLANLYTPNTINQSYVIKKNNILALSKSGNNYIFKKYDSSINIQDTYFVLTMDGRWYSPTHKVYIIPTIYVPKTNLYNFSYRISETNPSNDRWMITTSNYGVNYEYNSSFGNDQGYNVWKYGYPVNGFLGGGTKVDDGFIKFCSQHDTANDLPMFLSESFAKCKNEYYKNILIDPQLTTTIRESLQFEYVKNYPLYKNSVSYCNSLSTLNQTNCFNFINSECKDYMLEYGPCKVYCKIKPNNCTNNLKNHCSNLIRRENFFDETKTDELSETRRNLCGCNMSSDFYTQIFDAYNSNQTVDRKVDVRPECYFKECVLSNYKQVRNLACPPYQICISKIDINTSGIVDKSKINIRENIQCTRTTSGEENENYSEYCLKNDTILETGCIQFCNNNPLQCEDFLKDYCSVEIPKLTQTESLNKSQYSNIIDQCALYMPDTFYSNVAKGINDKVSFSTTIPNECLYERYRNKSLILSCPNESFCINEDFLKLTVEGNVKGTVVIKNDEICKNLTKKITTPDQPNNEGDNNGDTPKDTEFYKKWQFWVIIVIIVSALIILI